MPIEPTGVANDRLLGSIAVDKDLRRLLDIEEIKQLKYRYCHYNDGGWPDQPVSHVGPAHELFTEDGVWDGRPVAIAVGRAQLRQLFDALADLPMVYHAVTNPLIEINGDEATAHWHLLAGGINLNDRSTMSLHCYHDEYVRTPEGWRIKLMRVIWGHEVTTPEGWKQLMPEVLEPGASPS